MRTQHCDLDGQENLSHCPLADTEPLLFSNQYLLVKATVSAVLYFGNA